MKIAYTAGPMRPFTTPEGKHYTWEDNIHMGRKAHDRAVRDGWYVISPHLLGKDDQHAALISPDEYIRRDLEFIRMVRPDIILLPRWGFSDGARQEYGLAVELGLDIYYYQHSTDTIKPWARSNRKEIADD